MVEKDRKDKIADFLAEAKKRGRPLKKSGISSTKSQTIIGDGNFQAWRDININVPTTRTPVLKISPPRGSIGEDPVPVLTIKTLFNKLGDERKKRYGERSYEVMYKNFKRDFGIKNNKWTIIWTWPRECAPAIIEYLNKKFDNTIRGRIEKAGKKETYVPKRPHLYKKEKELLSHFGLTPSSSEVKQYFFDYFGVSSHTELSHLQHWQWVCYLKEQVKNLEE